MITLTWILFAISIVILIISFIMAPDSNSFSGALVGSADLELFKDSKEKGSKKVLKYSMFILGILLMLFSVITRAVM